MDREPCKLLADYHRQGSHLIGDKMKPSEQCKEAGLKSLTELVDISGVSEQTLINWHKNKPDLFAVVIAGAQVIKEINIGE